MMKTAKISFEVENNFEPGDCVDCPLYSLEYTDCNDGEYWSCQLGYPFSECPIELECDE